MMMMGEMNGEKMLGLPVGSSQIQNGFAEMMKIGTLKLFAHVISTQIVGWTMLDFQISVLNAVFDGRMTDADVMG